MILEGLKKERIMSVVKQLNESASTSYRNEQSRMLAERTQMLINISKKAREESLTLQETNDLYAEFNKAYDLSDNAIVGAKKNDNVSKADESIHLTRTANALKAASEMISASVTKTAEPLKTVGLDGVDESWAIKLLKESELDEGGSKIRNNQSAYKQMIQPVLCEA
ncbi:MAG: hypothetical protein ACI84K_000949 [Pseudohongiellaceae bacterium]